VSCRQVSLFGKHAQLPAGSYEVTFFSEVGAAKPLFDIDFQHKVSVCVCGPHSRTGLVWGAHMPGGSHTRDRCCPCAPNWWFWAWQSLSLCKCSAWWLPSERLPCPPPALTAVPTLGVVVVVFFDTAKDPHITTRAHTHSHTLAHT
jgi:hypothetical protein